MPNGQPLKDDIVEIETEVGEGQIKPADLQGWGTIKPRAAFPSLQPSPAEAGGQEPEVTSQQQPTTTDQQRDTGYEIRDTSEEVLNDAQIIQINRSLRKLIEENTQLQKQNADLDQQLRNLRGQKNIDNNRMNEVAIQRDAYQKQIEQFSEYNKNYAKQIVDLQSRLAARELELMQQIHSLETQLAENLQQDQPAGDQPEVANQSGIITQPPTTAPDQQRDTRYEIRNTKSSKPSDTLHASQGALHASEEKKSISVEIVSAPTAAEAEKKGRQVVELLEKIRTEKMKLRKDEARVHYNMGNSYFNQGDYLKAGREYRVAVDMAPQDCNAHFNLAFVSGEYLNDPQTAYKHYQQYLFLNPGAEDADMVKQKILETEMRLRTQINSSLEKDLKKEMNKIYNR